MNSRQRRLAVRSEIRSIPSRHLRYAANIAMACKAEDVDPLLLLVALKRANQALDLLLRK